MEGWKWDVRVTASILKQDLSAQKVQNKAIY